MYFIKSPYILSKLTGKSIIWHFPEGGKRIFITFDDGPIPHVTPQILSILNKYNAKASFFCVGENVLKHPDIFNEIIEKGHSIGNHTYNHLNGWETNLKLYLENIRKAETFIKSNLFRPPYGKVSPLQIKNIKNKYFTILWSVLSGDFDKTITKEKCLQNVVKNTKDGSIVVFHDSLKAKEKVLYTLPLFIEHFQSQGFTFESITNEILLEYRNKNFKYGTY